MMTTQQEQEQALAAAFGYLAQRDRTVEQVRAHLKKRGMPEQAAASAIAELTELRYLDDAAYAEHFVEDRRTLDGWGRERIARRLAQDGVDARVIAAALDGAGGHDELRAAVELLHRRLDAPPTDPGARTRALGLLVRRGYELELAQDAVRQAERELAGA